MKLKTLVESKLALESLLKGSLPISIAWELKKFLKVVNPELSTFEELRDQKVRELGEEILDETGKSTGQIKVKETNIHQYVETINELLSKDIDVTVPQIKIKELLEYKDVKGKQIELTTSDLFLLDWLIIE